MTGTDRKHAWAAGGVVLAIAAGAAGWMALRRPPAPGKGPPAEVLAARRERAAGLEYPAAGAAPASLKVEFDAARSRTRMTLTLKGLSGSAPGARLSGVELTLTSEFEGAERREGELSVRGRLAVVSSLPGVLAPSSPPAVVTADGVRLHARAWEDGGGGGYKSAAKGDGSHESLLFRLPTRDVLRLAGARAAEVEAGGGVKLALTPAQLREVREFAARMKPNTP